MQWLEIRKQYPNKFVLIGEIVEEKMSETQSKILEGTVLKISDNGKEIRQVYQQYKHKGKEVLYSLPLTPEEFIVENIPYKGIIR
ncbi:hypothetical protein KKE26_02005 [bacterium]|nr:hypothetical protein [bacterium]MBU1754115.1 hypothetical protein [bacterium]